MNKLGDFVAHPQFYAINEKIYGFKQFKESTSLPAPWDAYPVLLPGSDEKDESGSFAAEHIFYYGKKGKNLSKCVTNSDLLMPLLDRMMYLWRKFDREWTAI